MKTGYNVNDILKQMDISLVNFNVDYLIETDEYNKYIKRYNSMGKFRVSALVAKRFTTNQQQSTIQLDRIFNQTAKLVVYFLLARFPNLRVFEWKYMLEKDKILMADIIQAGIIYLVTNRNTLELTNALSWATQYGSYTQPNTNIGSPSFGLGAYVEALLLTGNFGEYQIIGNSSIGQLINTSTNDGAAIVLKEWDLQFFNNDLGVFGDWKEFVWDVPKIKLPDAQYKRIVSVPIPIDFVFDDPIIYMLLVNNFKDQLDYLSKISNANLEIFIKTIWDYVKSSKVKKLNDWLYKLLVSANPNTNPNKPQAYDRVTILPDGIIQNLRYDHGDFTNPNTWKDETNWTNVTTADIDGDLYLVKGEYLLAGAQGGKGDRGRSGPKGNIGPIGPPGPKGEPGGFHWKSITHTYDSRSYDDSYIGTPWRVHLTYTSTSSQKTYKAIALTYIYRNITLDHKRKGVWMNDLGWVKGIPKLPSGKVNWGHVYFNGIKWNVEATMVEEGNEIRDSKTFVLMDNIKNSKLKKTNIEMDGNTDDTTLQTIALADKKYAPISIETTLNTLSNIPVTKDKPTDDPSLLKFGGKLQNAKAEGLKTKSKDIVDAINELYARKPSETFNSFTGTFSSDDVKNYFLTTTFDVPNNEFNDETNLTGINMRLVTKMGKNCFVDSNLNSIILPSLYNPIGTLTWDFPDFAKSQGTILELPRINTIINAFKNMKPTELSFPTLSNWIDKDPNEYPLEKLYAPKLNLTHLYPTTSNPNPPGPDDFQYFDTIKPNAKVTLGAQTITNAWVFFPKVWKTLDYGTINTHTGEFDDPANEKLFKAITTDYEKSNMWLDKNTGNINHVSFPQVTKIGDNCTFQDLSSETNRIITVGDLTSIGENSMVAGTDSSRVNQVPICFSNNYFPNLETVGNNSFGYLLYGDTINFDKLKTVEDGFCRMSATRNIWITEKIELKLPSLTSMGNYCFNSFDTTQTTEWSKASFKNIDFPELTSMKSNCFVNINGQKYTFPKLKTMGKNCFGVSDGEGTYSFPIIETIGDGCFYGVDNAALTTFELPAKFINDNTWKDRCFGAGNWDQITFKLAK